MKYDNLDVIVPTYNRAKYLRTCLTALCESVAEPRKVIVLNNASTDNTIDVVNEICLEYPDRNIEVITNPKNLGNAGNFIKTQEIANNEYVAIFHDDDAVHPEYIARAMKVMTEDKTLVLCTGGGRPCSV